MADGSPERPDPGPARESVDERVRRYALLRAARRALGTSSPALRESDEGVAQSLQKRLRELAAPFTDGGSALPPDPEALRRIDALLAHYAEHLRICAEHVPLPQLRATLSSETHSQRVETSALLQLCLESEAVPQRHLRVVDFVITLLSGVRRDGQWRLDLDPAELNAAVRARAAACAALEASLEAEIVRRFDRASERLAQGEDGVAITAEMAAYKVEIAACYFAPSVLRSVARFNIVARNHFEDRRRHGRELDAEIEGELGLFAPLLDQDPRAALGAGALPAYEVPGVLAVQEAIRRRLRGEAPLPGPAARLAAELDLDWLEAADRDAFLDPVSEGLARLVRTTVVLGHLALRLPERRAELAALAIDESQLDAWVCAICDQAQREVDALIRDREFDDALSLGQTKSRFLAAARVVARRRLGRGVTRRGDDSFEREAAGLLREQLERRRPGGRLPLFFDLLGGGWRRTAVFAAVGLAIAVLGLPELLPSSDPRRVHELARGRLRDVSSLLEGGYRDHAAGDSSMFIGTLSGRWSELDAVDRRRHAELIRDRLLQRGVSEFLLFDSGRVLQAHWVEGDWRTGRWR